MPRQCVCNRACRRERITREHEVQILKGEEIFRQAALDAVSQFVFKPAVQNGEPVAVWLSQAINFDIK